MRKTEDSSQCTFAFASTSSIACLTVSNYSRFCELFGILELLLYMTGINFHSVATFPNSMSIFVTGLDSWTMGNAPGSARGL